MAVATPPPPLLGLADAHEYHFSFMGICRVPSDDLSIDRTAAPASEPLPPAAEPRFGRIDIKFFPRSNGAAGLLYFTGSTSFNIALRHWTYKRMREKAAAEHAPANAYRLTNGVVYPVYIAKSGPWCASRDPASAARLLLVACVRSAEGANPWRVQVSPMERRDDRGPAHPRPRV